MKTGIIEGINGPVVLGKNMEGFTMKEMVTVGKKKLIGEIIALEGDKATVQVYEDTEGLTKGEEILGKDMPLSVTLGPGMLGGMFDGIERPLETIYEEYKTFLPEGIGLLTLDEEKKWPVTFTVKEGQTLKPGDIFATVPETPVITHRCLIPPNAREGVVRNLKPSGEYNIVETVFQLEGHDGTLQDIKLAHQWPVRVRRPVKERLNADKLLLTGQRVFDVFFPIAKGGTTAIPGGFGTGKTMTQHQIAKFCDADIIIYIGCGERGNEMTEVLEDFPKLIDPYSKKPLMDRTILIANTSNMPVAAREASIYTGITMAEYFRDMGYHVAMMADSTSRWAEALREISGRLEEMPAEEGYPAYLPSRIAEFYERAGYARALNGEEGSITVIGAVSPAGGDFSEPVTENTKRFVNVFLALDKELAYSRHYPAIQWMTSYSGYAGRLKNYYDLALEGDLPALRTKFLSLLHEEAKLQEIVLLVGEDVLPDDQRWILEICRVVKVGFLQQNAFNETDTFVPLQKQYDMLDIIDILYREGKECIEKSIPLSKVKNDELIAEIIQMKYNIGNDEPEKFTALSHKITETYEAIKEEYERK